MAYPNGFRCGDQDVVRWDSQYGQIEHQANVFAANLLMPLDDYRRQIDVFFPTGARYKAPSNPGRTSPRTREIGSSG